jgi:hypothetical protein
MARWLPHHPGWTEELQHGVDPGLNLRDRPVHAEDALDGRKNEARVVALGEGGETVSPMIELHRVHGGGPAEDGDGESDIWMAQDYGKKIGKPRREGLERAEE